MSPESEIMDKTGAKSESHVFGDGEVVKDMGDLIGAGDAKLSSL